MNPRDMLKREIENHAISFGLKEQDAYRVSMPIVARYDRGQHRRIQDLFDEAKKQAKMIVKGYK